MDRLGLHPVDILVVLKLAAMERPSASVRELASALHVSKSAVAQSIRRLAGLNLVAEPDGARRVNKLALRGVLEHAVQWIAPGRVEPGFELGLLTAHSAPSLAKHLRGDDDPVVLPLKNGPSRGRAVRPVHPSAPQAAEHDPKLHQLLAIVDALRIGRAREREVAVAELRACL